MIPAAPSLESRIALRHHASAELIREQEGCLNLLDHTSAMSVLNRL